MSDHVKQHQADDNRLYSMAYVRLCKGDHKAALLLAQLVYWWPKKRANHRGVKKSYGDWEAELMLSEKEVKRINKVLEKELGLVEIYQEAWGHFKSISTFYVLSEQVLGIKAPSPTGGVVVEEAPSPKGGVASKAPPPKVGITDNTTSLTEKEESKPVAASHATASLQPQPLTGGSEKSKPTPVTTGKKPAEKKSLNWWLEGIREHHPTKLIIPPRETIRNLGFADARLNDSGLSVEQRHAFWTWCAGEGWLQLRTEWHPVYSPEIGEKEQAPWDPDLAWLVGSKKTSSGQYRLGAAVSIWRYRTGQVEDTPIVAALTVAVAKAPKPVEQADTIPKLSDVLAKASKANEFVGPPKPTYKQLGYPSKFLMDAALNSAKKKPTALATSPVVPAPEPEATPTLPTPAQTPTAPASAFDAALWKHDLNAAHARMALAERWQEVAKLAGPDRMCPPQYDELWIEENAKFLVHMLIHAEREAARLAAA